MRCKSMIKIELNKDMCDEIDKFVATMVKEVDFRPNFFDNSEERSPGEIQENAIEGKYAELGFYQYIQGTKYESTKLTLIYTNVENGMTEILKLPIEAPHTRLKLNHLL